MSSKTEPAADLPLHDDHSSPALDALTLAAQDHTKLARRAADVSDRLVAESGQAKRPRVRAAEPRMLGSEHSASSFAAPHHGHLDRITAVNNAYWGGFHDGQRLTLGRRAPALEANELELTYLKGFAAGVGDFREQALFARSVMEAQPALLSLAPLDREQMPVAVLNIERLREPPPYDPASYAARRLGCVQSEIATAITEGLLASVDEVRRFSVLDDNLLLPPALMPVAGGMQPRSTSTSRSSTGSYIANELKNIPPPTGMSRNEAGGGWPSTLKDELFAKGTRGCWMVLERHNVDCIDLDVFIHALSALSERIFPGEQPLSFVYDETFGPRIDVVFVEGSASQVARLVRHGTWSTSLLSFFAIPNVEDRDPKCRGPLTFRLHLRGVGPCKRLCPAS